MKNGLIIVGFFSALIAVGVALGLFLPSIFGFILGIWITALVLGVLSQAFYYQALLRFGVWGGIILITMGITKYVT